MMSKKHLFQHSGKEKEMALTYQYGSVLDTNDLDAAILIYSLPGATTDAICRNWARLRGGVGMRKITFWEFLFNL